MATTVPRLLAARVARDPGSPLITYYDTTSGERTELSGVTFANWVAKTANFVLDELGLDEGDAVDLALATSHPGHWVTLAWEAACWQSGVVVTVGAPQEARAVVTGPDGRTASPGTGVVVACALHPLGLGFAEALPPGVVDFALEVRSQPDAYLGAVADPQSPAWSEVDASYAQDELADGAVGPARRRLVRPGRAWATAYEALVVPLRDRGSTVVVTGEPDPGRLARIVADERVDG